MEDGRGVVGDGKGWVGDGKGAQRPAGLNRPHRRVDCVIGVVVVVVVVVVAAGELLLLMMMMMMLSPSLDVVAVVSVRLSLWQW